MSRTITITLEDAAYQRLQEQFGAGAIESIIENFPCPYTITEAELDAEYMAMAADQEREAEASCGTPPILRLRWMMNPKTGRYRRCANVHPLARTGSALCSLLSIRLRKRQNNRDG